MLEPNAVIHRRNRRDAYENSPRFTNKSPTQAVEIDELLAAGDKNSDGQISFDELFELVR